MHCSHANGHPTENLTSFKAIFSFISRVLFKKHCTTLLTSLEWVQVMNNTTYNNSHRTSSGSTTQVPCFLVYNKHTHLLPPPPLHQRATAQWNCLWLEASWPLAYTLITSPPSCVRPTQQPRPSNVINKPESTLLLFFQWKFTLWQFSLRL